MACASKLVVNAVFVLNLCLHVLTKLTEELCSCS